MEDGKTLIYFYIENFRLLSTHPITILDESETVGETSKLQDQFNAQRARMKELYLHKEKECSQVKQKLQKLQKELDDKNSQLVIAEYNREKVAFHLIVF